VVGIFTVFLKIAAEGGAQYVSGEETFETQCGPESAHIEASSFDDSIAYTINEEMPFFEINQFEAGV